MLRSLARRQGVGRSLGRFLSTGRAHPLLVTTPVYYVNAAPHIGHLHSTVVACARARHESLSHPRSEARAVALSTGTDEHGQKVAEAAAAAGESPKEYCDRISGTFFDAARIVGALPDAVPGPAGDGPWVSRDPVHGHFCIFTRTTDAAHHRTVASLWAALDSKMERSAHEGWYCVSDECFVPDSQVVVVDGAHVSAESGRPVTRVSEDGFTFPLSSMADAVASWLARGEGASVTPAVRRNEARAWVRAGLPPLSVSRPASRVPWGVPVPGSDGHETVYVWLDALGSYITAKLAALHAWQARAGGDIGGTENGKNGESGESGESGENGESGESGESGAGQRRPCALSRTDAIETTHVVGKDILRFHAIYWPAFLLAAGLRAPDEVVAHAHWTVEGQKMSKSIGNVVPASEMVERYGVDAARFFLLREGGLADDGDFRADRVAVRCNAELCDTLGNLVSRCVAKRIAGAAVDAAAAHSLFADPRGKGILGGALSVNLYAAKTDDDVEASTVGDAGARTGDAGADAGGSVVVADARSLAAKARHAGDVAQRAYANYDFPRAIGAAVSLARDANGYFSHAEPWALAKVARAPGPEGEAAARELAGVVSVTLDAVWAATALLSPVIPAASRAILDRIGRVDDPARCDLSSTSVYEAVSRTGLGGDAPAYRPEIGPFAPFRKLPGPDDAAKGKKVADKKQTRSRGDNQNRK